MRPVTKRLPDDGKTLVVHSHVATHGAPEIVHAQIRDATAF